MAVTSQNKQLFEDYEGFVEKFKPKKTTDDCYTPQIVYDAILGWACKEYDITPVDVVRPFWPGGDYEHFDYPEGCVVMDNPPFSIISKIVRFYAEKGIRYFLFAPALTCLGISAASSFIIPDTSITYANGAVIPTAFVTNLDQWFIRSAPDLTRIIEEADKINQAEQNPKKQIPKYTYPAHVVTSAMFKKYSHYGVDFRLRAEDCYFVRGLDAQKEHKKSIFGSGFLLSDEAAAEKAAAEKAAAEKAGAIEWALSDREREIIKGLGRKAASVA